MTKKYKVYTDGAATMKQNDGKYERVSGGWAFVILDEEENVIKTTFGGQAKATNNAMELEAINAALQQIYFDERKNCIIEIYSDSAYCVNIFTKWINGWRANGWTRGKEHKEIENVDKIMAIDRIILYLANQFCEVRFIKVKGHDGNKWNEYVDECAVCGKKYVDNDPSHGPYYSHSTSGVLFKDGVRVSQREGMSIAENAEPEKTVADFEF